MCRCTKPQPNRERQRGTGRLVDGTVIGITYTVCVSHHTRVAHRTTMLNGRGRRWRQYPRYSPLQYVLFELHKTHKT